MLSSTGTSNLHPKIGFGSTGQKRKTSAGHELLAIVTAEIGERIVQTLRDMTQANTDMEVKQLDWSMHIHGENMAYRWEHEPWDSEHK